MKFLILSNTISNAGDYLFLKGGMQVIKQFLGLENSTYINIHEQKILPEAIVEYDFAIYVGGPLYTNRLLENEFYNIVMQLKKYNIKLYLLGCGWYGANDLKSTVNNYHFSDKSRKVLDYISQNGLLGCRDYLSDYILKINGYNNCIVTGCPAWYLDLNQSADSKEEIKKVVISDIGLTKSSNLYFEKKQQFDMVLDYVKNRFYNCEIIVTFNNGIETRYSTEFNKAIEKELIARGIKYFDLSYRSEGFYTYDDCDLHVGFRVHSHIYCLTKGIPSILICEDARGLGMNATLGLSALSANISTEVKQFLPNNYLERELAFEVDKMLENRAFEMVRIKQLFKYFYKKQLTDFFSTIISKN